MTLVRKGHTATLVLATLQPSQACGASFVTAPSFTRPHVSLARAHSVAGPMARHRDGGMARHLLQTPVRKVRMARAGKGEDCAAYTPHIYSLGRIRRSTSGETARPVWIQS